MQWNDWNDFWNMGGYGLYVWPSFGACLVGMVIEPLLLRKRRQAILSRLPGQELSS